MRVVDWMSTEKRGFSPPNFDEKSALRTSAVSIAIAVAETLNERTTESRRRVQAKRNLKLVWCVSSNSSCFSLRILFCQPTCDLSKIVGMPKVVEKCRKLVECCALQKFAPNVSLAS